MTRHASAEELGNLAMGNLPPRKTSRVSSHLAACAECQHVSSRLEDVSSLLQNTHYSPMPQHLSIRLHAALVTESASRVASAPPTEAGRRDLPARRRSPRWRPSSLTSPVALRVLAATGAAVIVAGGGYAAFSQLSQSGTPTSAAVPAAGRPLTLAPKVTYGHSESIETVRSNTDFVPAKLVSQAESALANAPEKDATFGAPATGTMHANNMPYQAAGPQMDGCVARVAAGRKVLLVEIAKYLGSPAWIIVLAHHAANPRDVVVVSTNCSATDSHVLAHKALPRS
jgi:hypothetical protein